MTRISLPQRRELDAFEFELGGLKYRVAIGRFTVSGEISEIFINAGKPGSAADILSKDLAVVFSIARQYSVPLDTIQAALLKLDNGKAAGPLGRALQIAEELRKIAPAPLTVVP
jgi:ribonucleoside-diphosphate reductase alpha chain